MKMASQLTTPSSQGSLTVFCLKFLKISKIQSTLISLLNEIFTFHMSLSLNIRSLALRTRQTHTLIFRVDMYYKRICALLLNTFVINCWIIDKWEPKKWKKNPSKTQIETHDSIEREDERYLHELTLLWNVEYEGRFIWHLTSAAAARYSDISTSQHFTLYALW